MLTRLHIRSAEGLCNGKTVSAIVSPPRLVHKRRCPWTIRTSSKPRLEDLPQLTDLLFDLFTMEGDFVPNHAKQMRGLRLLLEQPNRGRIFVLRQGARILGMINLLFTISTAEGGFVVLLEDVVVHREYRGQGFGDKLLRHAIEYARKKDFLRVTLLTDRLNEEGQRFFKAHGFFASKMIPMRLMLVGFPRDRQGEHRRSRVCARRYGSAAALRLSGGDLWRRARRRRRRWRSRAAILAQDGVVLVSRASEEQYAAIAAEFPARAVSRARALHHGGEHAAAEESGDRRRDLRGHLGSAGGGGSGGDAGDFRQHGGADRTMWASRAFTGCWRCGSKLESVQRADRGRRDGRRAAERGGGAGEQAGDRGADERGLRGELRRARRAAGDAE